MQLYSSLILIGYVCCGRVANFIFFFKIFSHKNISISTNMPSPLPPPKIGQFILFIGFGGLALVYSILILVQERLVVHTCKVTVKFTARNRCLEMHIILKTGNIEKNNL